MKFIRGLNYEIWKLHGIGNDFVAIDGRFDNKDASDYSEYAKAVCHRKFSVGADGLLVVKILITVM